MGIPESVNAYYDALYDFNGIEIMKQIRKNFPTKSRILDVGGGWGKYRILLHDFPHVDCVEVWEPNIRDAKLDKIYTTVFHSNISDFKFEWYDILIFGDVLEHIEYKDALRILNYLWGRCSDAYFAIPYSMPQDADENPYELHIQTDLTVSNMEYRYPMLSKVVHNSSSGIYHLRPDDEWDSALYNRVLGLKKKQRVSLSRILAATKEHAS